MFRIDRYLAARDIFAVFLEHYLLGHDGDLRHGAGQSGEQRTALVVQVESDSVRIDRHYIFYDIEVGLSLPAVLNRLTL